MSVMGDAEEIDIDMSGLTSGVYLVSLRNPFGQEVVKK